MRVTISPAASRSPRGLSAMVMKPELRAPKAPPVTAVTDSTAGSSRTRRTICAIFSSIAWNEEVWSPRMKPTRRPVSCCGKKPFGISM